YLAVAQIPMDQQTVAQLNRPAELYATRHTPVGSVVLQVENAVCFDAATPVIIHVFDAGDRPEPIRKTIEEVNAKVHQHAAAGQFARKIKSRGAPPLKFSPILPIVRVESSKLLAEDAVQQTMVRVKPTVHANREHQVSLTGQVRAGPGISRGCGQRL